ncbi:MAG: DNA repair protein RecN [Xanthomonadales bacterium]|nr:DNA repair protein RecN [Xanthomonadales bacterium]
MLRTLYVKDFAIVDEAEVAFGRGMTVVTGETGAGKSLLVDALLLLSGARADASLVRHGCERAELSAEFDLRDHAGLLAWLKEQELDEGESCQLRRVIRSEGSSRAWINGRPVSAGQLRELAAGLVEIHGQHEQQALLERAAQLALLDAFGGHAAEAAEVARLANAWREAGQRIAALSRGADHAERMEWLAHQLDELDRHALAPEALAELEERHRRLAHAGQLLEGCAALAERLDGDDERALLHQLGRAQGELARLATLDEGLAPVAELLDAAAIQLGEARDALARYSSALDLDPEKLAEAAAGIATLHDLARKHRVRADGLMDEAARLRGELETLRNAGGEIERLEAERVRLLEDWSRGARVLARKRADAAWTLAAAVSGLMGELGMGGGRFEVQIQPLETGDPDPQGGERCEFLVSANPGQPPRPLRKVASGGELSRISLAIEVAALGSDNAGTMVFDEVDSGIGGAVAEIVGQKLRTLGARCQVLCVTHLPQVASLGHQHLRVSKWSEGEATRTRIDALEGPARREEIARMLGGVEITPETLAHAGQMLGKRRLEIGD